MMINKLSVEDFNKYFNKYDISVKDDVVKGSQIPYEYVDNLIKSKTALVQQTLSMNNYPIDSLNDIDLVIYIYSEVATVLLFYYGNPDEAWLKHVYNMNKTYKEKFEYKTSTITGTLYDASNNSVAFDNDDYNLRP